MGFVALAITGYFLISLEAVFSKFLLSRKLRSWQVYSFYVGLTSLFAFIVLPFSYARGARLSWPGIENFSLAMLGGMMFFLYLILLYRALRKSTASRVYILSGVVSVITTFILSQLTLGESLDTTKIAGLTALIVGGFIIAIKIPAFHYSPEKLKKIRKKEMRGNVELFEKFWGAFFAGFVLGLSLILLKHAYDSQGFMNGYLYSKIGTAISALALFLVPAYQKEITKRFKKKEARKKSAGQIRWVIVSKVLAGVGTLLTSIAISIGSVTIVTALASVQYLFTFLLSVILSLFFHQIFIENLRPANMAYKLIGVILVVAGVIVIGT